MITNAGNGVVIGRARADGYIDALCFDLEGRIGSAVSLLDPSAGSLGSIWAGDIGLAFRDAEHPIYAFLDVYEADGLHIYRFKIPADCSRGSVYAERLESLTEEDEVPYAGYFELPASPMAKFVSPTGNDKVTWYDGSPLNLLVEGAARWVSSSGNQLLISETPPSANGGSVPSLSSPSPASSPVASGQTFDDGSVPSLYLSVPYLSGPVLGGSVGNVVHLFGISSGGTGPEGCSASSSSAALKNFVCSCSSSECLISFDADFISTPGVVNIDVIAVAQVPGTMGGGAGYLPAQGALSIAIPVVPTAVSNYFWAGSVGNWIQFSAQAGIDGTRIDNCGVDPDPQGLALGFDCKCDGANCTITFDISSSVVSETTTSAKVRALSASGAVISALTLPIHILPYSEEMDGVDDPSSVTVEGATAGKGKPNPKPKPKTGSKADPPRLPDCCACTVGVPVLCDGTSNPDYPSETAACNTWINTEMESGRCGRSLGVVSEDYFGRDDEDLGQYSVPHDVCNSLNVHVNHHGNSNMAYQPACTCKAMEDAVKPGGMIRYDSNACMIFSDPAASDYWMNWLAQNDEKSIVYVISANQLNGLSKPTDEGGRSWNEVTCASSRMYYGVCKDKVVKAPGECHAAGDYCPFVDEPDAINTADCRDKDGNTAHQVCCAFPDSEEETTGYWSPPNGNCNYDGVAE